MSVQRHRRMLAAGEILFREGEAGDVAYVIEDGRVEIYTGPAHQRRVVARLGRDD
ncbi:UNVERIFIED_CONTAM: cyclic nucleotide-binding domain-containing protein, partial [Salmonella enterica subsp. enterica serovar Weltevreden]